jgi:hypothetical protein
MRFVTGKIQVISWHVRFLYKLACFILYNYPSSVLGYFILEHHKPLDNRALLLITMYEVVVIND